MKIELLRQTFSKSEWEELIKDISENNGMEIDEEAFKILVKSLNESGNRQELKKRVQMVAAAGKLSQYPGNVFEVLEDSDDYVENLKVIKRITKMGHKSIMEHDYLVFALVDVTPIIEQIIIGFRLTSFTIKSRRYVDFRDAGFHMTDFRNSEYSLHMENKDLRSKYRKHMNFMFKEYSALVDAGIPNEDARFVLPYSFHSNIVMGLDARELEKMVIYLLYGEYSKITEVRELGEKLFDIIKKQVPYLTANIEKYVERPVRYDYRRVIQQRKTDVEILKKPRLLDYDASPDDKVIETMIMYENQCGYDEAYQIICEAEEEDSDFRAKVMDEIIHKDEARELEQVSFTYQIPISLAVLTHLTRHRMHSLMVPNFVPLWNFKDYIIPDTIKNSIMLERFKKAVETNMKVMEEFRNSGVVEEDLVYFYLGAQMCNVITTMNARSLVWFSRMRCCNRAQWQIRNIANVMTAEAKKVAPLIGRGFGPSCVVDHICNEGKKSCGLLQKILEKEAEK